MKKEIKTTAIKLLKFAVIFFVIDFAFGFIAKKLYYSQESGKCARLTYSIDMADEDILVFGSSQAIHHIIPEIISDSLNMSCYNAGVRGQELLFNYTLQKLILERTTPKIIILNIDGFWLYESMVSADRLSDFYPYYQDHKKVLKPIISEFKPFMNIKLFFKGYQYNSTIVHVIKYFFSPQTDFKGYMPLYNVMTEADLVDENKVDLSNLAIDPHLVSTFENFIAETKARGVKLIITITPSIWGKDFSSDRSFKQMVEIAKENNIAVLDYSLNDTFTFKYDLFNDYGHLNDTGARVFTPMLAHDLANLSIPYISMN